MKKTGYDPFWDPWPPLQNAFFCVFPVLYAIDEALWEFWERADSRAGNLMYSGEGPPITEVFEPYLQRLKTALGDRRIRDLEDRQRPDCLALLAEVVKQADELIARESLRRVRRLSHLAYEAFNSMDSYYRGLATQALGPFVLCSSTTT